MLRRNPFMLIFPIIGIICLVFFGLLMSPLGSKLFGSAATTFSASAATARSPFVSPTPTPKIRYDKSISWQLYDSRTGTIVAPATEPPTPTASVAPDYWFKGAGSDPVYTENDGDYGGVGEGATSTFADQRTEPPRPSY